uniref:Uncharacterized protein n=1 Tax=viral metagenome TaxID=1070528 RepID=A0A6C0JTV1_9ZZZZ
MSNTNLFLTTTNNLKKINKEEKIKLFLILISNSKELYEFDNKKLYYKMDANDLKKINHFIEDNNQNI